MPRPVFEDIVLNELSFDSSNNNGPAHKLNVTFDATFRYGDYFGQKICLALFQVQPSKGPKPVFKPLAEIAIPLPLRANPTSVKAEMPFEKQLTEKGVQASVARATGGWRVRFELQNIPIRGVLWPGTNKLAFTIAEYNKSIPISDYITNKEKWDRAENFPVRLYNEQLVNISKIKQRLDLIPYTRKYTFKCNIFDHDMGLKDKVHLYSINYTNIGRLNYIGNEQVQINGKIYVFQTHWSLGEFGQIPAGHPVISIWRTYQARGLPINISNPWPGIEAFYNELKELNLSQPVDTLPWSPVTVQAGNTSQFALEKILLPYTGKSNDLANTAFGIGMEALEHEESPDFLYALRSAMYSALLASRWAPNNLHAWACFMGFSWYTKYTEITLDIFLMLNLRFMLMDRILKEKVRSPIWYATHQTLAWFLHQSVKRFYIDCAFKVGLANHIPIYFDTLEKELKKKKLLTLKY